MDLIAVSDCIADELEKFEQRFTTVLRTDVELINEIITYIAAHKGKRLRPILIFLTANLNGRSTARTLDAALIVELIHTASLIHDDVVDDAELRRGAPSTYSIWKNRTSILIGDYLFSQALQKIVQLNDIEISQVIAKVTRRMSEGELLQMQLAGDFTIDESTYFRMIADKTACFIASACEIGALTSSNKQLAQREQLRRFGEYLGMAFQIRDDLLDYIGSESTTGKPVGNDLKQNKITLPLLYALQHSDNGKAEQLRAIIQSKRTPSDFETIQILVSELGGVQYAQQKAEAYARKAVKMLSSFVDSPYKDSLEKLADFAAIRTE
ncbi:polyprenyl synthetase family protein [candidate division KSB1 bacterium]|nr:MAG: polyprenyl synthetase family protein [candidate division KSB1 bacterium]